MRISTHRDHGDTIVLGGRGPTSESGWLARFDEQATLIASSPIERDRVNREVELIRPGPAGTVYIGGPNTPVARVCAP